MILVFYLLKDQVFATFLDQHSTSLQLNLQNIQSSGCFVGSIEEMWNVDLGKLQRPDLLKDKKPRSINMIQIGNALNDKKLDPPIKSLFVWNSDVANCAPDSISVRKGLKRKDLFTVVHETFWTDSCDYADIVLPADTQLEHMDLHAPYGHYYFSLTQLS